MRSQSAGADLPRPFRRAAARGAAVILIVGVAVLVAACGDHSDSASAAAAGTIRLRPVADTTTRSDRPRARDGRATALRVAAGRTRRVAFLRFVIPPHPGRVVDKATLRVRATARARRTVVVLRSVRRTRWSETALRWRHQPRRGRVVARASRFRKGSWVSFDATRLVPAARRGPVAMALAVSSRAGAAAFRSREARGRRPRLVVRTRSAAASPPGGGGSGPGSGVVVTIAGDIAGGDSGRNDEATAALVQSIDPDVALTAGDNAYESGTLSEYTSQYAPSWGRFKARTRPVPGNHEYDSANAQGYYDYFNGAGHADGPAGPRGKGYYSFDAGAWHLIALNPHVSASAGSPQEQWLRRDLAAHSGHCTLAYWHEPRFTSGAEHSDDTSVAPFWKDLYAAHADLVVNGHNHQYERFAPQDPSGKADATGGIREFVVGTGGAGLYPFATPQPNSRVRDDTSHGVLKLTLHRGSYDWRFVPIAGDTFTDSGSGRCHHPSSAAAHRYPMRGVFFRQSNGGFSVQLAHGFNLVDSTPGELGGLPAGIKGLTWVGNYNRATCRWETTDAQLAGAVRAHVGDPKVGVWFISDEPWQGGTPHCPAAPAQHRARSDLIHSIDPNAKTLIVLDGNSDRESVDQLPAWKGTADYVGVNAYICWHGQPCHYEWIDKLGHAAAAAGLPLWGVIQAFGDTPGGGESMCTTMNGCGIARLPTPAELHEEFVHWRATSMLSYLVFSWRWPADTPSLWLEHHPELQDQLRTEAGS